MTRDQVLMAVGYPPPIAPLARGHQLDLRWRLECRLRRLLQWQQRVVGPARQRRPHTQEVQLTGGRARHLNADAMRVTHAPDVAVVGGGPAGSIAATLLADAGLSRRRPRARALPALPHRRVAALRDDADPRGGRCAAAHRGARIPARSPAARSSGGGSASRGASGFARTRADVRTRSR